MGPSRQRTPLQDDKRSWPVTFSPDSPKGTQAEPGKSQGKAHRQCNSATGGSASRVLGILTSQRDSADTRHREKNSADYLKPEKMKDMDK
jgi:hypothetical protein